MRPFAEATSLELETEESSTGGEPDSLLHASVYNELRRRFITGQIVPGRSLSTRGLALELGSARRRCARP
jgi:DNA-binding GntR family transcriptional regulator